MPKFSVMTGNTHLGDLEAGNRDAALAMAHKAFPGVANLRVEGGDLASGGSGGMPTANVNFERANPVSASEMKKAVDRMIGRTNI